MDIFSWIYILKVKLMAFVWITTTGRVFDAFVRLQAQKTFGIGIMRKEEHSSHQICPHLFLKIPLQPNPCLALYPLLISLLSYKIDVEMSMLPHNHYLKVTWQLGQCWKVAGCMMIVKESGFSLAEECWWCLIFIFTRIHVWMLGSWICVWIVSGHEEERSD